MLKYSGGYVSINPNFVVGINEENTTEIGSELYGIISVIYNILFRGVPTKPSPYLQEKIGNIKKIGGYKYHISNNDLKWSMVIKGGNKQNPALTLYEELKKKLPNDYHFFLPECRFSDIIENERFSDETSVDFYNPLHKIVIEVDGSQHQEKIARTMDKQRDIELQKQNISVIRIPTEKIYKKDLSVFYDKLQSLIKNSTHDINFISTLPEIEKNYLFAFRFQIALLIAIEKGLLNPFNKKTSINILIDSPVDIQLCHYCIKDLEDLFKNLYALLNKKIKFQDIDISINSERETDLVLDIGLAKKYDEKINTVPKNMLILRNSYFFYPLKDKVEHSYSQYKNYYSVKISNLRFKNVKSNDLNHHNALLYFWKLIFNFNDFRPNQENIICSGLDPKNGVIGLLPTGSGKSSCFQLVGLLTPGISIVISPLRSLMEDQCDNLYRRHRINTAYFLMAGKQGKLNEINFQNDHAKFLYIAPERFFNKKFKDTFNKKTDMIGQIIVDEVHCLSEWGHDFRTSYLLLFGFLKSSGLKDDTLLMGTSATASLRVISDISKEFEKLNKTIVLEKSSSVNRTELTYGLYKSKEKYQDLSIKINKIIENNEKAVIFMPKKPCIRSLFEELSKNGINVSKIKSYSSEEKDEDKRQVIQDLKSGKINVIIATKAFGMGIDIPDIRHTIHYCIGSSIESMYQEMGRAGRDKKPADCYVLFNKENKDKEFFQTNPNLKKIKKNCNKKENKSELKEQLYLLTSNNTNPDIESLFTFNIYQICKSIEEATTLSNFFEELQKVGYPLQEMEYPSIKYDDKGQPNIENFKIPFEKALYKLYLLKLIDLWTINYAHNIQNPIYGNISIIQRSPEEVQTALEEYIKKYDTTYEVQDITTSNNYIKKSIEILCQWSFENFFMTRWSSLRTLYDMLYSFSTSEEFAKRINNYFSDNKLLDEAFNDVMNYNLWFKVLDSQPPETLKDQISRYTEEYNNIAINFISGVTYLQLNDFKNINGKQRLHNSLEYVRNKCTYETFIIIIKKTLNFIKDKKHFNIFIDFLCDYYPDIFKEEYIKLKVKNISNNKFQIEKMYLALLKIELQKLKKEMEK